MAKPLMSISEVGKIINSLPESDWIIPFAKNDVVKFGMKTVEKVVFDPYRKAGFEIIYWKRFNAPLLFYRVFYAPDEKRLVALGNKVLKNNRNNEINTLEIIHTEDPLEVGRIVKVFLENHMGNKAMMPFIGIGKDIRKNAREICGPTLPENAPEGTVRHFSRDTHKISFLDKRSLDNVMHCPDPEEEYRYGMSAPTYEAILLILAAFPKLLYHIHL